MYGLYNNSNNLTGITMSDINVDSTLKTIFAPVITNNSAETSKATHNSSLQSMAAFLHTFFKTMNLGAFC